MAERASRMPVVVVAAAWLACLPSLAYGAATDGPVFQATLAPDLGPVVLVRPATDAIRIDGVLAEWSRIKPLGKFTAEDLKRTGRTSLEPGTKSSVRVTFWGAWDDQFLYVAVKVHDTSLAMPDPKKGWGATKDGAVGDLVAYDGVSVNLQPYPDVWKGPRALPVKPKSRKSWYHAPFVMSPYKPGGGARRWPGLSTYAARVVPGGYDVEGRIAFTSLGFLPSAGDQMAFCLHVIDLAADGKRPSQSHLWNVIPMPPGGWWWKEQRLDDVYASWGRLRLVNASGWGASLVTDGPHTPLGTVRYVGTVDVGPAGLDVAAVEMRRSGSDHLMLRLPVNRKLTSPGTYRLFGEFGLQGLPAGRYRLDLAAK